MEETIKTSILIDRKLWKEFKIACLRMDVPMSAVVELAIKKYLEKNISSRETSSDSDSSLESTPYRC